MIKEDKKKRIESLTTEEMLFEINRGHKSRFQREAFDYLKTCYELRKAKIESTKIKNITQNPTANNPNNVHNPFDITLKKIAVGVTIIVLGAMVVWVLNHYFNLGL